MSSTRKLLKRGGALASLVVAMLALVVPAAGAAPPEDATKWLKGQLKAEAPGQYCELFGTKSVGQTIDCMLAFDAAGAGFNAERTATYSWILANKNSFVGPESCKEEPEELSAAAVAKLAIAVLSQGGNPKNVGGRNLISDLKCLQEKEPGPEQGRFKDIGPEDFSSVFGQSMAVIALRACTVYCPGTPTLTNTIERGATYLRSQQCEENGAEEEVLGAFRSPLGQQGLECDAEPPFPESGFNPDAVEVDSTGVATQALLIDGTGESGGAAAAAITWLEGRQQLSGAWQGYCSFAESEAIFDSANGTALGTIALAEIERQEESGAWEARIEAGQEWLGAAVTTLEGNGLPECGGGEAEEEGNMIATAQGILGLYGVTYPQLVGL